ncbi:RadC family protein [Caminibacter pacificus]
MKKIVELFHEDKPREKLIKKGVKSLKNLELIAVLLGSGIKGKDVLKLSREIEKIIDENITLEKLLQIKGLGVAKAAQILSALEFSKRILLKTHTKIETTEDIVNELKEYSDKKQEYFIAIYLDGADRIIEKRVITIGILDKTIIHPREVFAPAIELRAASVIIAHNHPSGNPSPSRYDIILTDRLKESAEILGIDLIEHMIISKEGYYSFNENGYI